MASGQSLKRAAPSPEEVASTSSAWPSTRRQHKKPRKIAPSKKLNSSFYVGKNLYVTFGLISYDRFEAFIRRRDSPVGFSFPLKAWNLLVQNYETVLKMTESSDASSYELDLDEQDEKYFYAVADAKGATFTIGGTGIYEFKITPEEAALLSLELGLIDEHNDLLKSNAEAIGCMFTVIEDLLVSLQASLFGGSYIRSSTAEWESTGQKFDETVNYIMNYVTSSEIFNNFQNEVKARKCECSLRSDNLFLQVLKIK